MFGFGLVPGWLVVVLVGGLSWWSFLVVFLLCIGYFVVPFSLVEMCSLGQQPASKELQTKIKLDFRSKHLRLRLLTAPVRTLIETCSDDPDANFQVGFD
ncbi:hypothetical protein EFM33_09340 [Lentilactobacillus buchneri]|nr:hypothetical protein [Lentilactobacillus buchneri]